MERLDDNIKECFERLVVFDEDTIIPAEVLATVWGTKKGQTVKYMKSEYTMYERVYVEYCMYCGGRGKY